MYTWTACCEAGPDAGATICLGPGAFTVGRHRLADITIDDRGIEAFHLRVVVGVDETLELVQLAGRLPVVIDGSWQAWTVLPNEVEAALSFRPDGDSHVVDLGHSRLVLRYADYDTNSGGHRTARRTVTRAVRTLPVWRPTPIPVPTSESDRIERPGGLVPAAVALGGAGLMAVLLHQPLFFVFGFVGALAAGASWLVQWRSMRTKRRRTGMAEGTALQRFERALVAQRADRFDHQRVVAGSLGRAVGTLDGLGTRLWERRADHPDAFRLALGVGDVAWDPVLESGHEVPASCWAALELSGCLPDAPVAVDLGPGTCLAVAGQGGAGVVRSLVVQLAVNAGPADWRLIVVTDSADRWSWTTGLPHLDDGSGQPRLFDEQAAAVLLRDTSGLEGTHLVIVTDLVDALAMRTSPLRRLVAGHLSPALVVITGPNDLAPAICTARLECVGEGSARWRPDVTEEDVPQSVRIAGMTVARAAWAVRILAGLRDPEDLLAGAGELVNTVSLVDLLSGAAGRPLDAEAIAAAWSGLSPDAPPSTPIGCAADGVVDIDLVRDGPHALLAGTTGAGKSELLRALVLGLAARSSPDHLNFVLVDYKGGATFDVCSDLPHVVGVVTDLDDNLAERALRSLSAELHHRERVLRRHGAADLVGLRRLCGEPVLARLVVVVDEFAALAVEQAEFLHALVGIAQRGRSLGVHLVLATQRPGGVISEDIRANTNLRIALRVQDIGEAMDVVGDPAPALLSRRTPGRAVMRLGAGEYLTFQTAHTGRLIKGDRTEATVLAEHIVQAARINGLVAPRRPWTDPLPAVLDADTVADGAVGVVDLPDSQQRRPLVWQVGDGNLAVIGAKGSGVTSTLATLSAQALRAGTVVYVIDAAGDNVWDSFAEHPGCAGVVRLHERERLMRLFGELTNESVTRGRAAPSGALGTPTVLVVDGVGALRIELERPDMTAEAGLFHRIMTTGTRDVTALIGAADVASVPTWMVTTCAHRWLLHLHDPAEAAMLGVSASVVPPAVPGRMRVIDETDIELAGAEGQLVAPAPLISSPLTASADLTTFGSRRIVTRISEMPAVIDAIELVPIEWTEFGIEMTLGRWFDTTEQQRSEVPDGEHLCVLGPARSGRSSCLARLLHAWHDAPRVQSTGARWCGMLTPRRSALAAHAHSVDAHVLAVDELLDRLPCAGPALVLIDDAELVDDAAGRLAGVLATPRPGLLVAIAARPEALRSAYGHWTSIVRRSRRGLIMSGAHETDGDLLGVVLPRRIVVPARPGLAHAVEDGECRLLQVALDQFPRS